MCLKNALLIQKVDMIANHMNCFESKFEDEVGVTAKKATKRSMESNFSELNKRDFIWCRVCGEGCVKHCCIHVSVFI